MDKSIFLGLESKTKNNLNTNKYTPNLMKLVHMKVKPKLLANFSVPIRRMKKDALDNKKLNK